MGQPRIVVDVARAQRGCAYCGGKVAKGERFIRVSISLWSQKGGAANGGLNICGRCITQLALDLNGMGLSSPRTFEEATRWEEPHGNYPASASAPEF